MPDKNRKSLGRGLDSILQSPETDITSRDISGDFVAGAIAEIDINLIETNPFQPRTEFDETALRELAQSIKEQGVIQPVTQHTYLTGKIIEPQTWCAQHRRLHRHALAVSDI